MFLRLGDPPSPVPEPFAALLLAYIRERPNTEMANNPNSRWLFPRLNARTATIRHLVLQAPASIVAEMLGYHVEHAHRLATEGGGSAQILGLSIALLLRGQPAGEPAI